jgi:hypothetical protein
VTLAHLLTRDIFGVNLPPSLGCLELCLDREFFEPPPNGGVLEKGDLVFFGPEQYRDNLAAFEPQFDNEGELVNYHLSPIKHVAVFTGDISEEPKMELPYGRLVDLEASGDILIFTPCKGLKPLTAMLELALFQPAFY